MMLRRWRKRCGLAPNDVALRANDVAPLAQTEKGGKLSRPCFRFDQIRFAAGEPRLPKATSLGARPHHLRAAQHHLSQTTK